jgi:hypothetical protein
MNDEGMTEHRPKNCGNARVKDEYPYIALAAQLWISNRADESMREEGNLGIIMPPGNYVMV